MLNLDVRSVILIAGIMSLMMSIVLLFLRRNFPPSIKGLSEWAAAPATIFPAALLFGARGTIPDFFSIVIANLLLFSGTALLYFGSQRFFGFKPALKLWSGLILATMAPLTWFALVAPHHGVRVMFITSLMAALSFAHTRLILVHGARTFSSYFAATALLTLALTQALRFVSAVDLPAADGIFDNTSPAQVAYVSVYAFTSLTAAIGVVLMATDKLRAEFEHLASHDSLTGILTRRALIDACEQELARGRRKGHETSLLMLDLDHFKTINDCQGHLAGDRALVEFVARVAALLRRPDRFGRFGGEEFVALLPETSPQEALIVAERIRADVETACGQSACTVSIGTATSRAGDTSVDALLARADAALYRAKAAGRNRVMTTT